MNYTVKDIAEITGHSVHTIRYYAKEGLFPNIDRDEHGVRIFTQKELHLIYLFEHLKRSGLTIKEIKQFIDWSLEGNDTIELRKDFFTKKYMEVEQQLIELQHTFDFLKYKKWEYEKASKLGTCDFMQDINDDLLTDELRIIRDRINAEREYSK